MDMADVTRNAIQGKRLEVVSGLDASALLKLATTATEPVLLKGLIKDWPLVQAGLRSNEAAAEYLLSFYGDVIIGALLGGPETCGRVFYNEQYTGFNFQRAKTRLNLILEALLQQQHNPHPPLCYVGSTSIDTCLPGMRADNDLPLASLNPLASIWIGNQTRIAAHNDLPDNIACAAVGRRRFTLFPPAAISDLYIGPVDVNPAGRPISLVDFDKPDFERFPRFRSALQQARVAELEPGDAVFIPSLWWHHVASLDSLNVLVNYWWRTTPAFMDTPTNVLNHALLSLRDLPIEQRRAWKQLFDYYVFEATDANFEHIPEKLRGPLATLDPVTARKLRADILNGLNR